ncbi:MAG: Cobalamin-binding protein precursor [Methanosaeta sp. PtaB.Bin039]|mgnify:CR=1 FL=1|nr:MAG: Cobalamin-binding protein precursor [Methanosaeta sp. PtaB.Bin039]HOT06368.1 ABC transporter substrate-binding protein [Methanotrichaceae archaeon]HQF16139.1 ABC transporter substrate-binding protein [Methanotrichaceae archaeon]HQI90875.1 ABC transporter substrate-binding protein [Methanotrichaceae archaeon]HQJ28297.1 ABC transporter substrate-binding protein [Methanotrichaceae archaeon]
MMKTVIRVLICFGLLVMAGSAEEITVVDSTGRCLSLDVPVQKVVSLGTGVAEYLYVLDGGKSLVGRDSYSHFPPALEEVAIAGKSSYSPDLELIVSLHPDLVIADTMLSDDNLKELENAGIPVMIESLVDPAKDIEVMERLGALIGKEERSLELIGFIKGYQDLIRKRTAGLKPDDKPKVFLEWAGKPYHTISSGNPSDTLIRVAGGDNVAKDLGNRTHSYITVSPEWVVEVDPDVIIQQRSSNKAFSGDELRALRDEIIARPELADVKAVKDGRVYLVSGEIRYGVRSVICQLYMANMFYPGLFEDVDLDAVHRDLVKRFYGIELDGGLYVYPN